MKNAQRPAGDRDKPAGQREPQIRERFRDAIRSPVGQKVIGGLARGFTRVARTLGRERASAVASAIMCFLAPLFPENRIGAANIAAGTLLTIEIEMAGA